MHAGARHAPNTRSKTTRLVLCPRKTFTRRRTYTNMYRRLDLHERATNIKLRSSSVQAHCTAFRMRSPTPERIDTTPVPFSSLTEDDIRFMTTAFRPWIWNANTARDFDRYLRDHHQRRFNIERARVVIHSLRKVHSEIHGPWGQPFTIPTSWESFKAILVACGDSFGSLELPEGFTNSGGDSNAN